MRDRWRLRRAVARRRFGDWRGAAYDWRNRRIRWLHIRFDNSRRPRHSNGANSVVWPTSRPHLTSNVYANLCCNLTWCCLHNRPTIRNFGFAPTGRCVLRLGNQQLTLERSNQKVRSRPIGSCAILSSACLLRVRTIYGHGCRRLGNTSKPETSHVTNACTCVLEMV